MEMTKVMEAADELIDAAHAVLHGRNIAYVCKECGPGAPCVLTVDPKLPAPTVCPFKGYSTHAKWRASNARV